MLTGNFNWNTQADLSDQAPVYYVTIDGISSTTYTTAPVYNPAGTTHVILGLPELRPGAIDLIAGTWTVAKVTLQFFDVDGEASSLFGAAAPAAPVTTWKNRKVTVFGGYRSILETDYVKLFTGRVTALRSRGGVYELELADSSYMLDQEIMTNATAEKPTTITGNVVNVVASILRGVFSVSDPDFPLTSVTAATGSTSAPTGLGIADADLDLAGMESERDTWHPTDEVTAVFTDTESGKEYLQREFFRVFQARIQLKGDGTVGLLFNTPPFPASSAPVVDTETIVGLGAWDHLIRDHLNRFRFWGDHVAADNSFPTELYDADVAEDTADQSSTAEVVEYLVESKWLTTSQNGVAIAAELAGRMRQMWLPGPAYVELEVNYRQRRLEVGDVIAVSHPDIPNQLTGELGVEGRLMSIVSIRPEVTTGRIILRCLDIGLRRYGVIAGSSVPEYASASDVEKSTFGFVTASGGAMADGSQGYRMI